ncbi:YqzL family protein [Brevibacillus fulvus]|uniref:YqzL family protein n=1 Tax=Brevibacillus fulvus TaxID=1125967 RepID=UPI00195E6C3D|nr:YqzL family protein [Brevibacillus fulvus]
MLRDFSWHYFASTGDIHAYLLYCEHSQISTTKDEEADLAPDELGESQACL